MKFHIAFLIFLLDASAASVAVPDEMQMQSAPATPSDALERYKTLLQAEINTVDTQLRVLRNQIQSGKIDRGGPEIISARRALLQLRQRMAAFDAGVILMPTAPPVTIQKNKQATPSTNDAKQKIRQAREDFRKFLEEEIELAKLQMNVLDKKFEAGALDINGPEMISAKRDLFELQQRMAIFDAGLLLPPAANQPSR